MHLLLPLSFLLLQAALLALLPALRAPLAYLLMVAAPLLAALALWRRALRTTTPHTRMGWQVLGGAMLVWAGGAFANLWHEWVQGRSNEMYRDAMLLFQLAPVPVAFLLASELQAMGRRLVQWIDGALALALGYSYFLVTWAMLTARGAPDEQGVAALVWLVDAQNLFLAFGALVRWHAAPEQSERELFGAVAAYETSYLLLAGINNHFIAGDPAFGPEVGTIISLAFAWLAGLALQPTAAPRPRAIAPLLQRVVHSASPILLALTLMVVSLLLMRVDYALGATGVALAVLGYGLRSVLTQVRQLEHGDRLQRQHRQLEALAWTDALTGVANRHFLEHALRRLWQEAPPEGRALAVLMIDVDAFKRLNDSRGHAAGDACLREVATALHRALARPGDLLARYGGEEFIALLHDTDAAGALVVAERLREAVERQQIPHPEGLDGRVSVSVGCAAARLRQEADARQLIEAADRALYHAKSAGRNRVAA